MKKEWTMVRQISAAALAAFLFLSSAFIGEAIAAQGSGCMPTTGTVSGLTFAQDVNAGLDAIISSNSGGSVPNTTCAGTPSKGQLWLDTSVIPNIVRMYDGVSTWVAVGALDFTNHAWAPPIGGGLNSVTAGSTTDLCASPQAVQTVNGSSTITSFGTSCIAGVRKTLLFSGAAPITYNATSMIIPGAASYTTTAGDMIDAIYFGSGNWRIASITKADGSSVVNPSVPVGTSLYGDWGTAPPKTQLAIGQAISRASFPAYLTAVTRLQTGVLTSGNPTITSVANTAGLGNGMPLEGTGIPSGALISSVTSSSITMNTNATANGSQSVRAFITGYGAGGDSTTVGVRDCRGLGLSGRDDMGGTPAGRLTSSFFGVSTRIGTIGGDEKQTSTLAQLPGLTASQALSISVASSGQANTLPGAASNVNFAASISAGGIINIPTTGNTNQYTAVTGFSATVAAVVAGTGNGSGGGAAAAHTIVQPTSIAECVVVVSP